LNPWPLLLLLLALVGGCSRDFGADQHGQTVAAAELEGRWLIINYWAEWCAPCRKEIPELNRLAERMDDAEVQVLGVNYDGLQGTALLQSAEQLGIAFRVLAQDPAQRLQLPRSDVLPVTFVIDPQGRMREQLLGEQTESGLLELLQRLRTD
jgi:thiol-disulfide isomerase/thioredoxin